MAFVATYRCVMPRTPESRAWDQVHIGRTIYVFFHAGEAPGGGWSTGTGLIVQPRAKHGNRYHR